MSDPCVFECVPPPYIPPRRPRKPPGRVPHSTFLADLLPINKLTKITLFYLPFSRFLESPMCLKCGPCHVFFMFFTFRKVSFFLSFLEVKSRPRTSKKLTFRPSISFRFFCLNNCKHRIGLGIRETLLRSAFCTFSFFFEISCLFVHHVFSPLQVTFSSFWPVPRPSKSPPDLQK